MLEDEMHVHCIRLVCFFILFFQLGTAGVVCADTVGSEDKETLEIEKQLAIVREAAENGDSQSQHDLAVIYYDGKGVERDLKESEKWFEKSAEQGNEDGKIGYSIVLFDKAAAHYRGDDGKPDFPEALKWLKRSLEYGNPEARQAYISLAYEYGNRLKVGWAGAEKNSKEAFKWYGEAADYGNKHAQLAIATMYQYGEGVDQDYIKAAEWYKKAADNGSEIAKRQYPEVMSRIAHNYYFGKNGPKDFTEAEKYAHIAADEGDRNAQFLLSVMCSNGDGVAQDAIESIKWALMAAEQQHPKAIDFIQSVPADHPSLQEFRERIIAVQNPS